MPSFICDLRLSGHSSSINALSFSPDGKFIASGDDDGVIFIFDVETGQQVHKVDGASPVTALYWSSTSKLLHAGFGNGRLLIANISVDDCVANNLPRTDEGVVEYITCDERTGRLCLCVGPYVEIWTEIQPSLWKGNTVPLPRSSSLDLVWTCSREEVDSQAHSASFHFATETSQLGASSGSAGTGDPPRLQGQKSALSDHEYALPEPRSVHFINRGTGLVVSLLKQGILYWNLQRQEYLWHIRTRCGRSALSSDEEFLAVSNLYDGFDLYRTADQSHLRTIQVNMDVNVPLPVSFIDGRTMLLLGSSCGLVSLYNISKDDVIQSLDHEGEIVQALASNEATRKGILLATGCSERGKATVIRIWRASAGSSKVKPGSPEVDITVATDSEIEGRPRVERLPGTSLTPSSRSVFTTSVYLSFALVALVALGYGSYSHQPVDNGSVQQAVERIHTKLMEYVHASFAHARDLAIGVTTVIAQHLQELTARYLRYVDEA